MMLIAGGCDSMMLIAGGCDFEVAPSITCMSTLDNVYEHPPEPV